MESADVCNSYKEKSDFEVTDRQNTWRLRTVTAKSLQNALIRREILKQTSHILNIYI